MLTLHEVEQLSRGLYGVDKVGLEQRALGLMSRSIKAESKKEAIDFLISIIDLTTLEGTDTPGRISDIISRARTPLPGDPTCPSTAAVCVYSDRVKIARRLLGSRGGAVKLASVAGGFPHGRVSLNAALVDVEEALKAGADEIDMVMDRAALLTGDVATNYTAISRIKELCLAYDAHLKVILETGELGSSDNIRAAAFIAMGSGADFIKTSTGKIPIAATPSSILLLLEAARDWHTMTGEKIGVKPAGGIRTTKQALGLIPLVQETVGPEWLTPELLRIGASGLLDDLLMQRLRIQTGAYSAKEYVPAASGGY